MILIIDNYDSFTYNIAQALGLLGREVRVVRNDAVSLEEADDLSPEAIVISPGPGRPEQAGICRRLIEQTIARPPERRVPMLGVCLGHQCLAQALGAEVIRARRPVHGKTSRIFHDGRTIYAGLRNPFQAARYHSLIVTEDSVKPPLEVSAYTQAGEVMGLRAPELKLEGVQFHPESIATPQGLSLVKNFLDRYLSLPRAA